MIYKIGFNVCRGVPHDIGVRYIIYDFHHVFDAIYGAYYRNEINSSAYFIQAFDPAKSIRSRRTTLVYSVPQGD